MDAPQIAELKQSFIAEEVASALRHGVRNKLASVRNCSFYIHRRVESRTELLKEDLRVKQFFELIDSELDAATRMLETRLPIAIAGSPGTTEIGSVVRSLATGWPLPSGLKLELVIAESRAHVDPRELELALVCLFENALEALGGSGRLRIAVSSGSGECSIDVEDDGCGLPANAATKVFEPFFTTKPGRLGLGLNVARRIATRAGGRLELVAISPQGTRASLLLRAE